MAITNSCGVSGAEHCSLVYRRRGPEMKYINEDSHWNVDIVSAVVKGAVNGSLNKIREDYFVIRQIVAHFLIKMLVSTQNKSLALMKL